MTEDTPKNPKKKQYLRMLSQEELHKLVQPVEGSGFVTMLHPLEINIPKSTLDELTRESLTRIRESRREQETKEEKLAAERAIQQRVDFLAWLATQPEEVYMAIYPADMDGLEELEELADFLEDDENLDLPF